MAQTTAVLYRMTLDDHLCPSGLKAKQLLEAQGFAVDDRPLKTRQETDAFKQEHSVETTPQIWIDGRNVGGYTDLRKFLGLEQSTSATTYRPVIAIFSIALLMALALQFAMSSTVEPLRTLELFIAISVCFLAVQKLQDVEKFSTMFLTYDLLAQKWMTYGRIYPYLEAFGGVLMLAGAWLWLAGPIMLIVGGIGAISVFKAVYIDRRDLKCACVGGDSNVPLGFVSLTENIFMFAMGIWMLIKWLG